MFRISGISRDPQQSDPFMVSFPYYFHIFKDSFGFPFYSRIFRDSYGNGMGIVWETYRKGVPLLGVPENPTDKMNVFTKYF